MVKQSGEAFLLLSLCYFPHTAQSLGHSCPALCRARASSPCLNRRFSVRTATKTPEVFGEISSSRISRIDGLRLTEPLYAAQNGQNRKHSVYGLVMSGFRLTRSIERAEQ